ncbi:hypothetical protein KKE68_00620 [Patescibacteria group bacterium]|nr:hypothetical protein [Patescibacteria group bacterium]
MFFIFYIAWVIKKNYRYVKNKKAFIFLPLLQFTADAAVILGTTFGLLKRAKQFNYLSYIKQNKFLFFIIAIYTAILLLTLKWGTPNQNHPFPYHMDEWHQLMAIKAILRHGTTTIQGAAQIPFLYPVLSSIYLIPFILLHVVNPFSLKSPMDDLLIQQKLFEVLRSVNLLFGIGSILLISKIAKSYLKINSLLPIYLFTISPILLILSGHFKYDISLLFWIILSLALLLNFGEKPTLKNYIYASIACALALATKFSALPLFPLLIFSFFWYILPGKRNYKFIYIGTFFYALTFILIGSPNILFGLADYRELLYSNLISGPQGTDNLILPYPWWIYLVINVLPALFGHPLYTLGLVSFLYLLFSLFIRRAWKKKLNRHNIFFLVSFILFIISLVPLKMGATGNRALVLLPFLALISGIVVEKVFKNIKTFYKFLLIIILILIVFFQLFESTVWMHTKLHIDPQKQSSLWIEKNITRDTTIGVENIVIYQSLPNIIVKEFYSNQYNKKLKSLYAYKIIDGKTKNLPRIVVITNGEIQMKMLKQSVKKNLINRLQKEGYKKIATFSPDLAYYKLFLNDIDYYNTSIIALPLTISVYKKF